MQAEAASVLGLPERTYQNYERDVRAPNTEGWEAFVRAGINANWLLTGEGPMLLADLTPPPAKEADPAINAEALAAIMAAVEFTNPKASPPERAAIAAKAYVASIREGLITPTGMGPRAPKRAA